MGAKINTPAPNQDVTTPVMGAQQYSVQTDWSFAVVLNSISETALHGFSLHRMQTVVDHLSVIIASPEIIPELRTTCDKLIGLWQNIDLQ